MEKATEEERNNYQKEAKCWIKQLRNHPSIIQWVVFNEGWGQHDTVELTNMVMEVNQSLIIDQYTGE